MRPIVLPPNVLHHFYAGGAGIAGLRGLDLTDDHSPEEWIGAVNTTFDGSRGLSRLEDGTLLRMRVDSLDWMAGTLASLGCGFEIRSPDELRASVRELEELRDRSSIDASVMMIDGLVALRRHDEFEARRAKRRKS